jgi:predicted enzyme related to lactoylglutathione lyase
MTIEQRGRSVWYDLMTGDLKAAEEFSTRRVNGPMEMFGGDLIAPCVDPQGALVALLSSD